MQNPGRIEKWAENQTRPLTRAEKTYATKWSEKEASSRSAEVSMRRFFLHVNEDIMESYANKEFELRERLFIWQTLVKYVLPITVQMNLDTTSVSASISQFLTDVSDTGVKPLEIHDAKLHMPEKFKEMITAKDED